MLEILNFSNQHMMSIKKTLFGFLNFATILMAGNWSGAIAQSLDAAPIFQGIKNKIPKNLDFRLPTYMPAISEEVQPIFSISDQNIATVTLEYTDSRCRSLPKGSRGYLVGCRALSISSGSIGSDFWRQRVVEPKGEVFSLSDRGSAKHIQGDGWGIIAWANHGTFVSVYGPDRLYLGDGCNTARGRFCDFRSGELVKVVRSIASQPVISRNADRYLTDNEIDSLESEFQSEVDGFFRTRVNLRRNDPRANELKKFRTSWAQFDSSITPFLGNWTASHGEAWIDIYPTQNKSKVCVAESYTNYDMRKVVTNISIGTVADNKLLFVDAKRRKSLMIARDSVFSQSRLASREREFLAGYDIRNGKKSSYTYGFPLSLKPIQNNDFAKFGCTASLPSQVQLNR